MNNRQRKAAKKLMKSKYGVVLLVLLVIAAAFTYFTENEKSTISPDASAEFHFIDVGQGDATLVLSDEVAVLVDCGTAGEADTVIDYVSQYTDKIDLFVFSHAHDDHMGGAAEVINSVEVSEVLMTEYASDSAFFSRALDAIEENSVTVTEAVAGKTYTVGDVTIDVFSPITDYNDANNNSIVMRLEVDGASVMFTGDAESRAEADVIAKYGYKLDSDILKSGHHGSSTSNSEAFLSAVSPEYAVISCGEGNSYGHPHRETLELFSEENIVYYRTDKDGDIVLVCRDGEIVAK